MSESLALPYGIHKQRGGVGGMHFNCKAARMHVVAGVRAEMQPSSCDVGEFGILHESRRLSLAAIQKTCCDKIDFCRGAWIFVG